MQSLDSKIKSKRNFSSGKIMHEQIDFPGPSAVKIKLQEKPHFTYPWHFHSEYEILFVQEGSGTSFVADNIENFTSGDLVLIGSNLPHFWKSDESFHIPENNRKVKYIVIQFSSEFFKEAIAEYPEFNLIRELLKRSRRGVRFEKSFTKNAIKKINSLVIKKGFDRTLFLLHLLQFMAKTKQYKLLASELYQAKNHSFTNDRLTKVMHYLNSEYLKKVELVKVANVANMHPSAFCRYFKEKSGKSLSEFVNDMRIGYACRLIIEGKMSVSQVCFESGFNNLSNFNRHFKKHTGFTPTGYFEEFHRRD